MRVIDRRSFALGHGHARTRNQNAIRRICIHHSVTPATHSTANFENWWRNPASGMGSPPVGGYAEVILVNGDMELNFNPTQITHGVASQNDDSYHICVVGDFRVNGAQPTAAQMHSLLERLRFNMSRFNVPVERVLGHNEFPGNASNTCPGQNMNNIRNQLRAQVIVNSDLNIALRSTQGQITVSTTLRGAPSGSARAIRSVRAGTMFERIRRSGTWFQIRLGDGSIGWVRTRMFRRSLGRSLGDREGQTTRRVQFRETAQNGSSNVIRTLPAGQMVQTRTSGHTSEFLAVRVGHVTGFIRREAIRR